MSRNPAVCAAACIALALLAGLIAQVSHGACRSRLPARRCRLSALLRQRRSVRPGDRKSSGLSAVECAAHRHHRAASSARRPAGRARFPRRIRQSYKRIVILTPDHFRKADKPFATTRRGFETVKGKVATDADAVSRLLQAGDWIEESCLFDKDHGIRAMLPFVKHYFPEARFCRSPSRSAPGVPIGTGWRTRWRRWSTPIR